MMSVAAASPEKAFALATQKKRYEYPNVIGPDLEQFPPARRVHRDLEAGGIRHGFQKIHRERRELTTRTECPRFAR